MTEFYTRKVVTYCGFYFLACSFFPIQYSYLPLYCNALGFSPFQISLLGVISTLAALLVAPVCQHFAFHDVSPRRIYWVGSISSLVFYLWVMSTTSIALFIAGWVLFSLVCRIPFSLIEPQAVRDAAESMVSFERIRVFGSFGFILTTFLLGVSANFLGLKLVPVAGIVVLGLAVMATTTIVEVLRDRPTKSGTSGHRHIGSNSYVTSYALICGCSFVLWSSHAVAGLYLSLYLESLGWSKFEISWAWAVPVASEVLMFYGFHWLERVMSLELIMMISMSLGALRWFLLANFQNTAVILLAQTGHAFSFAPIYTCTIRLAHRILPDDLRDRGQGVLVAAGVGAGNLVGNLVAGLIVSSLPTYEEVYRVFWVPCCLALVGCLFSTVLYKRGNCSAH